VADIVWVCSSIYRVSDPEHWLVENKIMEIITRDKVYIGNVYDFVLGQCKLQGELSLCYALRHILNYLEFVAPRSKLTFCDFINKKLDELKTFEEKDCIRFWIAFFTIANGLAIGKLKFLKGED
jgi:hypothetical protein